MARARSFKGGHRFGNLEGSPRGRAIEELPLPKKVQIPLKQGFGEEVPPAVAVGDKVKAGQIIGRDDQSLSTPVHASISGEVKGIIEISRPSLESFKAVVIESDGKDEWESLKGATEEFEQISEQELGRILYEAGVTDCGKAGFPTEHSLADAKPHDIKRLLINAVETEPYLEGDNQLLAERLEEFTVGVKILRRALGNVEVHLGMNSSRSETIKKLNEGEGTSCTSKELHWLRLHPLYPKYPQGADELLIRTILGERVPSGGLAADVGVVVIDVQHVIAAYEAVVQGKPFIERVVSLGGTLVEPGNLKVRIGTAVKDLLNGRWRDGVLSRVIIGGLMRGEAIEDLETPLTRNRSGIAVLENQASKELFPFADIGRLKESYTHVFLSTLLPGGLRRVDTRLNGGRRACVGCSYCIDVCPQNLIPISIARYCQRDMLEEAVKLGIGACIDCGLCSFVCPAKISLASQIKEGKACLRRAYKEGSFHLKE